MAPELFRHIVALVGDDRRGAPQPVDLVVTRDAIEWTSCVDGAAANGAGAQTTGGQRRMRSRPSVGLRALLFGAGVAVARRIHPHFVFAAHEQSNAIVMHYLATPPTSTAPVVNADVLALPHSTSRPLRLSTTFALPSSAVVTALLDALHSVGVPVTQDPAASHRVLCRVRKPLLIFVNPYGGVKDAPTIFKNTVAPMLALAGVPFEQLDTQYKGHAEDVVRSADMNAYSGIIAVSGDGILHEICNGMMTRRDWRRARLVPVGTIGAGSSNAMNRNLGHMFPEYGVLSIIKETTQPTDLLSTTFHESKKVVYSHLSMSWAYIADVDIEQDKYRWMGREKTTFCALLRLFRLRKYRGHIGIQPFEANSSVAQAALEADMNEITKLDPEATDAMDTMQSYGPARSLKNTTVSDTSVYPIQMTPANDPISYFMANNVPWIASDVKASHVASMGGGFLHMVYGGSKLSRLTMLGSLLSEALPEDLESAGLTGVKARGFRLDPLGWSWSVAPWKSGTEARETVRLNKSVGGWVDLSGEPFGGESVTVEVHERVLQIFTGPWGSY